MRGFQTEEPVSGFPTHSLVAGSHDLREVVPWKLDRKAEFITFKATKNWFDLGIEINSR